MTQTTPELPDAPPPSSPPNKVTPIQPRWLLPQHRLAQHQPTQHYPAQHQPTQHRRSCLHLTTLLPAIFPALLSALFPALLSALLPSHCHSCGRYGTVLCHSCRTSLQHAGAGAPLTTTLPIPGRATPLRVYSAAAYTGTPRATLIAYKHGDTPQFAAALAPLLRAALRAALRWHEAPPRHPTDTPSGLAAPHPAQSHPGPLAVVPLPSRRSRVRQRGYDHLGLLLRRAGVPAAVIHPVLRAQPGRTGQVGLSAAGRERNAALLRLRRSAPARLRGCTVVLVDDVCTTGASLRAATVLLQRSGVSVSAAATLCVAQLRRAQQ